MALKEDVEQLIEKENAYQNEDARVAPFCYTQAAYDNDIVDGVEEYSFTNEQNIPLGTPEIIETSSDVLKNGVRSLSSSLSRMLVNHFFGRLSYNLNKIHDNFYAFLNIFHSGLGKPNGLATLDANGRLPYSMLPESAVELKGTWKANTNTPTLHDGIGTLGDTYIVETAGTVDLGSGEITFNVNDTVLYNGTKWVRMPAGSVRTVNSKQPADGAITLYGSDIAMSSSDTTKLDTAVNAKVPNTRTVNGKELSANVTLRGSDIEMSSSDTTKLDTAVNAKVPNTRTVNGKPLSANVTLRGSDIEVSEGDSRKISEALSKVLKTKVYTYVVNSNASLAYWLSNGNTGTTSGGNDFTSVLIKKGSFIYSDIFVPLDTLGTKEIDGETGAEITVPKIGYSTKAFRSDCKMTNVKVAGTLENMSNISYCEPITLGIFTAGIYWSTDGKNWTAGTGISGTVNAITYANGLLIAGSNASPYIYWSTDGKSWTAGTGISANVRAITYANGLWSTGGFWSTDGKSWTAGTGISASVRAITYANGLWIAGSDASTSGSFYWSTDGKSWTAGTSTGLFTVYTVVYANGLWVAGTSSNIYWSTDGKSWTAGTGISGTVNAVTYANGLWSTGRFWSTDGKNWTAGTGISSTVYAMTYTNGLWIAGLQDGTTRIYWSTDGKSWTAGTGISSPVYAITYANGLWSTGRYWSTDGKSWTAGTGITGSALAITYNKLAELQIKDSFSVQNCIALFEDSYATPNENEDYNCAAHPEKGFSLSLS